MVETDCAFPESTKFLPRREELSIVSPSGNEFIIAREDSPENEFLIVDQVNDVSILVRHANSAALLDEFSFDQTGRMASLVGRPRSGLNGSEIYLINLDSLDYETIGEGRLNFSDPLIISQESSGTETIFSYVSFSTIPGVPLSREKVLSFDPVTFVPAVIIEGNVQYLTKELNFTSNEREAQLQSLKTRPIASFYSAGSPVLLSSSWWDADYEDISPFVIRLNNISASNRSAFLEKSNLEMQLKNRFDSGSIEFGAIADKELCISKSAYIRPYPYEDFYAAE